MVYLCRRSNCRRKQFGRNSLAKLRQPAREYLLDIEARNPTEVLLEQVLVDRLGRDGPQRAAQRLQCDDGRRTGVEVSLCQEYARGDVGCFYIRRVMS